MTMCVIDIYQFEVFTFNCISFHTQRSRVNNFALKNKIATSATYIDSIRQLRLKRIGTTQFYPFSIQFYNQQISTTVNELLDHVNKELRVENIQNTCKLPPIVCIKPDNNGKMSVIWNKWFAPRESGELQWTGNWLSRFDGGVAAAVLTPTSL